MLVFLLSFVSGSEDGRIPTLSLLRYMDPTHQDPVSRNASKLLPADLRAQRGDLYVWEDKKLLLGFRFQPMAAPSTVLLGRRLKFSVWASYSGF